MNANEKSMLLLWSRRVLTEHTLHGRVGAEVRQEFEFGETLKRKSALFVTLLRRGQLRGCIGYIDARKALYQATMDNTINAASRDPRFPPVQVSELDEIEISISVLSEPEPIPGPDYFEVGAHGIILKKADCSSVFLPQVASEQGWTREETLYHLSIKAGLVGDAWREDDAIFEVFTAEVFGEGKAPNIKT